MFPRRPAFLLLVFLGGIASAMACDDGDGASATAPGGGPPSGDLDAPLEGGVCPTVAPASGDACLLPEGTTCAFGGCGTPIATCSRGSWIYGGNPPPRPPCPLEPPPRDGPCPACWKTEDSCTYGSESCRAPEERATATCPNGTWRVAFFPCAAPDDAGADVQGDAGPDAD